MPMAALLVLAACSSATPTPTTAPTTAPATEASATEAPTQATEAPTQATEAPTQATEAPTQATEAPTQATEAPTQATEASAATTPEPTLVPTVAPPNPDSTPAPMPQNADDLAKIKASGTLSIGISADYPPYAFFNNDFKIDGFEPALITDLAKRFDAQVDLNDFAFPGLLAALQIGQVDAVIAALSVTPEREQLVDFTNIYYIGADGVLGPADAAAISAVDDLAGKRVGAQTGSVYATYLKVNLVDKGLSKARTLPVSRHDGGIRDLKDGKIDFFMLDRLPAQNFAQTENLKVVGENFNPQRFAIAVRKGSNLAGALNDALLKAQNDGTVNTLIQEHLGTRPNQIEPVPTPAPVPTQPPPPTPTPGPTATPVRRPPGARSLRQQRCFRRRPELRRPEHDRAAGAATRSGLY